MGFLEAVGPLLELTKGVHATFLEAKLACTNQTLWAVPVELRNVLDRWIEAVAMIACITAVAEQDIGGIIIATTSLASLAMLVFI